MKPIQLIFLLFLIALSLQAVAQTSDINPLTEKSKAVQFQINRDFTLGSFQGAALSYKHHLQSSSALRVGLSFSLSDATSDGTQKAFNNDTLTASGNNTEDQSSVNIQLNTQAIWYSESSLGILFFYGTGPFVAFSRSHQKQETISSPVGSLQYKNTTEGTGTMWSLGLTGLAGVEWFVSKSISLHAEYGISLGYYWSKNESTSKSSSGWNKSTSESKTNSWQFSSKGVQFGLSVYF